MGRTQNETKIAGYIRAAQQCMKQKNKKGALSKLKLKKQYEKRNDTLEAQIFNLETQVMTLDDMLMNLRTIEATKKGAAAMKNVMGDPDAMLEAAEEAQENIQEAMALKDELAAIMGAPLVEFSEDDDELLAALEEEMMDESLGIQSQADRRQVLKADEKHDEPEPEEDDDDDEFVAEMKKLEIQLNQQPRVRREVQVVTSFQESRGAPELVRVSSDQWLGLLIDRFSVGTPLRA